jgi:hypothetical protein
MAGYYGHVEDVRDDATTGDLVTNDYGQAPHAQNGAASTTHVVSLSYDDGEILQQPNGATAYAASVGDPADSLDEYVVGTLAPPPPVAPAVSSLSQEPSTDDVAALDEHAVDVLRPLDGGAAAPPSQSAAPVPAGAVAAPAPTESRSASIEEDELAADMQAILSGQKVYDPASGKTVERDRLGTPSSPQEAGPPPRPEVSNEHAIFDAIADSMKYANAYDLGTVELENRFATFDRAAELDDSVRERRTPPDRSTDDVPMEPKVGNTEFLNDLDQIRARAEGSAHDAMRRAAEAMPVASEESIEGWAGDGGALSCPPSALKLALAEPDPAYAQPMYDSGEHAQAGGDLYKDQLRVGKSPGVLFSYGELIAMADLYKSPEQMMGTDVAELAHIKILIDRSTAYYKKIRHDGYIGPYDAKTLELDVSNAKWNKATGGRYLELAADNAEHFSPNTLFDDPVARAADGQRNNKHAWELHHQHAIEEARRMAADPANANRSYVPMLPLIINGFGDHFLTDAFASGHLINKGVMVAYFRKNFYSGAKLSAAGNEFFKRVAKDAFVGKVKRKFSALETYDYPTKNVLGIDVLIPWHPNIDNVDTFHTLLVQAAEKEQGKVANIIVKALHDNLNAGGVYVTNEAGDPQWLLMGDDRLNEKSLVIMQKAVMQSVANVLDPFAFGSSTAHGSTANFGPFFERVWRYVPRPTPEEKARLTGLVLEYTNPTSTTLSGAVSRIITQQLDVLIDTLISEKKLRPA